MKIAIIITSFVLALLFAYALVNYFIMRNVKTPDYKLIKKASDIEIRQYSPLLVAEVKTQGEREKAASDGFKQLASFIFGDNQGDTSGLKKISMTTPVLQQPTKKIAMTAPVLQAMNSNNDWLIKFVMPAQYTLQTLPKPNNQNIHIIEIPARKMLAIRFSGSSSQRNLSKHMEQLKQYIDKENIETKGDFEYAFYNPPWTLPAQRRNEILIAIA